MTRVYKQQGKLLSLYNKMFHRWTGSSFFVWMYVQLFVFVLLYIIQLVDSIIIHYDYQCSGVCSCKLPANSNKSETEKVLIGSFCRRQLKTRNSNSTKFVCYVTSLVLYQNVQIEAYAAYYIFPEKVRQIVVVSWQTKYFKFQTTFIK